MRAHQHPPVVLFADHLGGCRKIADHSRSGRGVGAGGRDRNPQVLADFCRHPQCRQLMADKQQPGAKGHGLPTQRNHGVRILRGRGKVPRLIKLPVVWHRGFGHHPKQLPAVADCRTVVKLVPVRQGQPDCQQHIQPGSFPQQQAQPPQRAREQRLRKKQIPAGVAGQRQLGEYRYPCAGLRRLLRQRRQRSCVALRVGKRYLWRAGRHLDKALIHILMVLSSPTTIGCRYQYYSVKCR